MILLSENKKFFKANMHCHSRNSDGALTVEKLKEEYMKRGYSIIAFTDHEHLVDNSRLTDENFLAITGAELAFKENREVSTSKNPSMRVCHLNIYALDPHNDVTPCYNLKADHFLNDDIRSLVKYDELFDREYSGENINKAVKIASEKGFLVVYNHPTWSNEDATQYMGYEGLFAVEIHNSAARHLGNDEKVFADMLRGGKKIFCFSADDNHNRQPLDSPYSDSFGGFIMINAEKLEYGQIMSALKNGNFYSSTGPFISHLSIDENEVKVKFSDSKEAVLLTKGRRSEYKYAEDGKYITEATFKVDEKDVFFRLRITDEHGKSAYTQAYYL